MILVWFIVGLVLAIFIARINNSNKLFWAAFTSFTLGIAAASIINTVNQEEEEVPTQVCPTQAVVDAPNYYSFLADVPPTTLSLVPNPVSQDSTPDNSGEPNFPKESIKDTLTDPPDYHPKIHGVTTR